MPTKVKPTKKISKTTMTHPAIDYFYDVIVYVASDRHHLKDCVATFKTLKEAEKFVQNNSIDIHETIFDTAEIHKLKFGAHYQATEERFIYKFDRITGTYYLVDNTHEPF